MKLAFAALATTLALASGASAMIGPYERAVNEPANHVSLFTEGEVRTVTTADRSTSPESNWTASGTAKVTVFPAANIAPPTGASAR